MPKTEADVDGGWRARVDAVSNCQAQEHSIPAAQARLHETLGWCLGVKPALLIIQHHLPCAIAEVAKRLHRARREADRALARAQQEVAGAARELAALGSSRRRFSGPPRAIAPADPAVVGAR
jgi:hypothetical protein